MPFSSSICLTNTGTLPLGSYVDIYSNSDSYAFPFKTNIALSQLTSNCPYILTEIPDGTTEIKFQDTLSHCCYNLLISNNNLCELFGIQLTGFSSTTISQIVTGLLSSSVGATITDYIIDWYGPDDNTTVSFTSGFGTLFSPYQQTHPFTRMSLPGYYAPMIRQIRINGINYSITGGTGFIQSNIDCLGNQTVEVFPSNCVGNRTQPIPINLFPSYNNFYFSNSAAFNTPPEQLSLGFDLDINTNYFAWQFEADAVSDTIKISFVSDNYPFPGIVLEYWTVGYDYTDTNFTTIPKVIRVSNNSFFKKVTNLTKLKRTENDKIYIEVTPNPANSRTNWALYFECLNTFNCETCLDTAPLPYKLISNSFSFDTLPCNKYTFHSQLSGCSCNDGILNTDINYYFLDSLSLSQINAGWRGTICSYNNNDTLYWNSTVYSGSTECGALPISSVNTDCDPRPGGSTTFQKTNPTLNGPGNIYMTFQYLSDLEIYWFSYQNKVLSLGLGTPFDNTNINYYRWFYLDIPVIPPIDIFTPCSSDAATVQSYMIHTSSQVTTGQTNGLYFMNVTMPLMTVGINFEPCDTGCASQINSYTNDINQNSLSEFNQRNFTSAISAKKIEPFNGYYTMQKSTYGPNNATVTGYLWLTDFLNETIPMSGTTYTPIPYLSATTCNFSSYSSSLVPQPLFPYIIYQKMAYQYYCYINTIGVFQMFDIRPNQSNLIYSYNMTTHSVNYIDNFYFIGPNITLSSTTISNGSLIPIEFKNTTYCGESNNSPAMSWTINSYTSGTTQTITSYEILCEDIDATGSSPNGYFVHWYVTGITSGQTSISVNGSWTGSPTIISTDYGSGDRANGWNGPCPPSGTHNYRIQVTARLSDNTTLTSNYLTFTST